MQTRALQTATWPARAAYFAALALVVTMGILGHRPVRTAAPAWRTDLARDLASAATYPTVQRDLDQIHASRSLRVLMSNSSSSYYVLRGEEYGFEFELARQIARELDLHLEVVLPDVSLTPMQMLQLGKVDVIAMPLLPDEQRAAMVALTVPYHSVQQRLAVHRDYADSIRGLSDLSQLRIAARSFSSGERELARLRRLGVDVVAVLHGYNVPQEEILDLVADGTYPAAIALDVEVEAARRFRSELRKGVALGPRKDVRWAVRGNSPQLLAALDQVLARHVRRNSKGRLVRSEFYNVIRARYFENAPRWDRHRADPFLVARTGRISPYDQIFREAARDTDFDWRLLAALAFQESRFDPTAVSWAGAHGIMQMRPRTAGVSADALRDPRLNITLGAAHLQMLYDRYKGVSETERMRFTLAAYNCGQGHLDDARKLSRLLGLDPDIWEGSVRESLLLLRQPAYHRMVRYGYVRGNETVAYVRGIEQRFEMLQHMTPRAHNTRVASRGRDTVLPAAEAAVMGAASLH
ncbi:hypothetical protein DRQ53_08415 [bacterium]|nr:MAG: hypothetical protein DRQ53_08415 [bacterium]